MPLLPSHLKRVASTVRAADFADEDIGGALTDTELTGTTVGETLFEMPSTAEGSGDGSRVQYGKEGIANTHPTDNLINAKIFFPNFLADWGSGTDTVVLTSSSEDDDDTKFARLFGFDINGDPIVLEVALDGTAEAVSLDLMSDLQRVTIHEDDVDNDYPLVATAGTLTITRGNDTVLGEIPAGYYSATAEIDAWLPATLNDTTTADDPATSPSGASWSRPRNIASALAVANGGELSAESKQGIWLRLTVKEGMPPSYDVEYLPAIYGHAQGV
jgi:hypothetical protein